MDSVDSFDIDQWIDHRHTVSPKFVLLAGITLFLLSTVKNVGFYFPLLSEEKNAELLLEDFTQAYGLSPREKEVFSLIKEGRSNSEIANDLYISEKEEINMPCGIPNYHSDNFLTIWRTIKWSRL